MLPLQQKEEHGDRPPFCHFFHTAILTNFHMGRIRHAPSAVYAARIKGYKKTRNRLRFF
ncbi:hypothetical protein O3299_15135 [Janthinobacterium sp. SUN176]|uniref:hypothetical protein n=1 Tax=Janthinobacterium sp. SUN176 TaxID=3014788 RepID=UPI0027135B18|nr:hypothetical protein [Janthinobacterium sp. SUN176]MDO8072865.1 hypothetical protein [Janthinobacterium sp. SUN176]